MKASVLTVRSLGSWWVAVPSAGIFMKSFLRGRKALLTMVRKCKYREILRKVFGYNSCFKSCIWKLSSNLFRLNKIVDYFLHVLTCFSFVGCNLSWSPCSHFSFPQHIKCSENYCHSPGVVVVIHRLGVSNLSHCRTFVRQTGQNVRQAIFKYDPFFW